MLQNCISWKFTNVHNKLEQLMSCKFYHLLLTQNLVSEAEATESPMVKTLETAKKCPMLKIFISR
jgi:hypothetical protein